MDTIFEWYVVRCGSKNIHRIGMCLKEIGLRSQIMLVILRLNNQHDFGWGGGGGLRSMTHIYMNGQVSSNVFVMK